MRHLIFVRHGESEHHVSDLTGGWTDTSLTTNGREQMSNAARYLQSRKLPRPMIYCSDLRRALESAGIIADALGCTPAPLCELREFNNGDAANLTREAASRIANTEPAVNNLDWRPYRNAETWREMANRVHRAFDCMECDETQSVIVVGHGNAGQALVQKWLGLEIESGIAFRFDVASVTELRVNEWGEREIVQLNARH